jgi:hypothetical protein
MNTAVGVVLAAVLAAGVGVLGTVVTANVALASAEKAASVEADPGEPADFYGSRYGDR